MEVLLPLGGGGHAGKVWLFVVLSVEMSLERECAAESAGAPFFATL